jgi:hypothetical protein
MRPTNKHLSRPVRRLSLRLEELEPRLCLATLVDPHTVTYQDADGHLATVSVSTAVFDAQTINQVFTFDQGSVDGDNSSPQQLQKLDLSALGPALAGGASVTITAGANLTKVGHLKATNIDLTAVTIYGDLGRIDAGDANTATPGLLLLNVQSIGRYGTSTQGPGGNLASNIVGPLGSLYVNGDIVGASLSVTGGANGTIRSIVLAGSLLGNESPGMGLISTSGSVGPLVILGNVEGQVSSGAAIASILVGGSLLGGAAQESGEIKGFDLGPVAVQHDIIAGSGFISGSIRSFQSMGDVTIGGSLRGGQLASDSAMGHVRITGDVIAHLVVSVGNMGGIEIGGSLIAGQVISHADMGAVTVGGDVVGGDADNSGQVNCGGLITSLSVGGSVLGGAGRESGEIKSDRFGSVVIQHDVTAGTGFLSGTIRSFHSTGDVAVGGAR